MVYKTFQLLIVVVNGLRLLFAIIFRNRTIKTFRIAFHKSDTRFGNHNILYCEKKIQANTIRKIAISNEHGCARQNNTTVKPFHNRPPISKILANDHEICYNLKKIL